ncbi:26056_t:CDS:1, partial [Dentiscutata erythropus]
MLSMHYVNWFWPPIEHAQIGNQLIICPIKIVVQFFIQIPNESTRRAKDAERVRNATMHP